QAIFHDIDAGITAEQAAGAVGGVVIGQRVENGNQRVVVGNETFDRVFRTGLVDSDGQRGGKGVSQRIGVFLQHGQRDTFDRTAELVGGAGGLEAVDGDARVLGWVDLGQVCGNQLRQACGIVVDAIA